MSNNDKGSLKTKLIVIGIAVVVASDAYTVIFPAPATIL